MEGNETEETGFDDKPEEETQYGEPGQQQQQYTQQPQYGQQYQYQPPTHFFKSESMIMWGVVIGVIVLLIGAILQGTIFFVDNADTMNTLMGLTTIFMSIGALIFVLFLTLGAVFKENLDHYVRFGLLLIVALILYALLTSNLFSMVRNVFTGI